MNGKCWERECKVSLSRFKQGQLWGLGWGLRMSPALGGYLRPYKNLTSWNLGISEATERILELGLCVLREGRRRVEAKYKIRKGC